MGAEVLHLCVKLGTSPGADFTKFRIPKTTLSSDTICKLRGVGTLGDTLRYSNPVEGLTELIESGCVHGYSLLQGKDAVLKTATGGGVRVRENSKCRPSSRPLLVELWRVLSSPRNSV